MTDRLVVCFRLRSYSETRARLFAKHGRELAKRALALGGRITAWDVGACAFDFALEGVPDAIELITGKTLPDAFGVGVSQGRLSPVLDRGSRVTVASGPALRRAHVLARMARPGETLLDSRLSALKSRDVLTAGSRVRKLGGKRIRGFKLDERYPFRTHVEASVMRLVESETANESLVSELLKRLEPAKLCVLSADPGAGGTRALADIKAQARLPALLIAPADTGEPLAALRLAIARADLENPRRGVFADDVAGSLQKLLSGAGLASEASAELIGAVVGANGLVLIDDAGEIDTDTLEAVARAVVQFELHAVVRIAISDLLPSPLTELVRGAEPILGSLDAEQQMRVARAFSADGWSKERAGLLGDRAELSPLAVREAMAWALESGELVWTDKGVVPRFRERQYGRQSAASWIRRRLSLLDERRRTVLEALAVLGGAACIAELGHMLDAENNPSRELDTLLAELASRHWLIRGANHVMLATRSARRAIWDAMSDEQRKTLHAAASHGLENCGRPLALASAALQAMLAGERARARAIAENAAKAAQAAGLAASAAALGEFVQGGERAPLAARGLTGSFNWETPSASPKRPNWAASSNGAPPLPPRAKNHSAPSVPRLVSSKLAESDSGQLGARPASEPPWAAHAAKALKDGDWESVQRVVAELREAGESSLAADRLEAMAELARGETTEALRLLRQTKERAFSADAGKRSRAALALAVALAAAGRFSEALLEALEALARARESNDAVGDRACARFLAQLSHKVGQEKAAAGWTAVGQR